MLKMRPDKRHLQRDVNLGRKAFNEFSEEITYQVAVFIDASACDDECRLLSNMIQISHIVYARWMISR